MGVGWLRSQAGDQEQEEEEEEGGTDGRRRCRKISGRRSLTVAEKEYFPRRIRICKRKRKKVGSILGRKEKNPSRIVHT